MIDAQTSRAKVVTEYLDDVKSCLKGVNKYSIAIIIGPRPALLQHLLLKYLSVCGDRLDLLSTVHEKAKKAFAADRVSVVQLVSGQMQTSRNVPNFLVSIHASETCLPCKLCSLAILISIVIVRKFRTSLWTFLSQLRC